MARSLIAAVVVAALAFTVPAFGGETAVVSASKRVAKALRIARRADRRSEQAIRRARRPATASNGNATVLGGAPLRFNASASPAVLGTDVTTVRRSRLVATASLTVGADGGARYQASCRLDFRRDGDNQTAGTARVSGAKDDVSTVSTTGFATYPAGTTSVFLYCDDAADAEALAQAGSISVIATADAGS